MNPYDVDLTKKFWLAWIEKYKKFDFLWDTQSEEHNNREKRKDAYAVLIKMAKKINPAANEEYVRHRINNIRTSYRREVKKILAARENGTCLESSWAYYKILNNMFRLDSESLVKDVESFEDQSNKSSDLSDTEDPFLTIEETKLNIKSKETISSNANQKKRKKRLALGSPNDFDENFPSSIEQEVSDSPTATQYTDRKRSLSRINAVNISLTGKRNDVEDATDGLEQSFSQPSKKNCLQDNCLSSNMLNEGTISYNMIQNQEDEWDILGRRIANHLRNMIPIQRLFAERIICEVCFQGRVEQLTWDSGYVTSRNSRQNSYRETSSCNDQQNREDKCDDVIDEQEYL